MSAGQGLGRPDADAARYHVGRIFAPSNLPRLAIIGAIMAVITGLFAYAGGWLSPQRLTQGRVVDQFERTNGLHPGFRRNHSKGICFGGWVDSDGHGQRLSKAVVFQPGRTPVFGRFAIAGGMPFLPDTPSAVRSMAVNFALGNGEIWRSGMNGIPVFTVRSVQDLTDQLAAAEPTPGTGKPDPAKLQAFAKTHPQATRAAALVKATPLASGFANTTFNSLNAFVFVDADGRRTPVRWRMEAEDPFTPAEPADATAAKDPNYQYDALATRVRGGPVSWRFVAIVGRAGDPTDDATVPWPADRERVPLGILTVNSLQDEEHGLCRDITFDPLVLPNGIEGSDDPILSARSATYAVSFTRRGGETPGKSAVQFQSSITSVP